MHHHQSIMIAGTVMLAAAAAPAQPYAIGRHTIDAGAGTSVGGEFGLTGTIGQHDTGGPSTGGGFELTGGFWAGIGPTPCNAADFAPPHGVLDLADVVGFISAFLATDPAADLDSNGVFDLADLVSFVSAFNAGCP
jgi:hypothetical protein